MIRISILLSTLFLSLLSNVLIPKLIKTNLIVDKPNKNNNNADSPLISKRTNIIRTTYSPNQQQPQPTHQELLFDQPSQQQPLIVQLPSTQQSTPKYLLNPQKRSIPEQPSNSKDPQTSTDPSIFESKSIPEQPFITKKTISSNQETKDQNKINNQSINENQLKKQQNQNNVIPQIINVNQNQGKIQKNKNRLINKNNIITNKGGQSVNNLAGQGIIKTSNLYNQQQLHSNQNQNAIDNQIQNKNIAPNVKENQAQVPKQSISIDSNGLNQLKNHINDFNLRNQSQNQNNNKINNGKGNGNDTDKRNGLYNGIGNKGQNNQNFNESKNFPTDIKKYIDQYLFQYNKL